jgi:hypothetical protein
MLLGTGMSITASADVDKRWDWPGMKRDLKICVSDLTLCPPNFTDSVKAAIDTWNADLTSWTLTFTTDCSEADIKVDCDNISGLGQWTADLNTTTKEATNHKIKVRIDNDWGWCDDKFEVVSTLMHEMGHAMRLDHTHATDQMRSGQGKTGHLRGISTKDSTEAALSDGSKAKSTDTTPSGAKKDQVYIGTITPGPGDPPLDLLSAVSVNLMPYRPTEVQVEGINIVGNDQLDWQAYIAPTADGTEPYVLQIEYPGPVFDERWGFLHVVELTYDELWEPNAVAPPDTTVQTDADPILLDASASTHGGGFDRMDFTWIVDNALIVKGEDIASITLPIGSHQVELIAVDEFGKESADMMIVDVLEASAPAIPVISTVGIAILIGVLVLLAVIILRRRAIVSVMR